jgi:hypothetical protein
MADARRERRTKQQLLDELHAITEERDDLRHKLYGPSTRQAADDRLNELQAAGVKVDALTWSAVQRAAAEVDRAMPNMAPQMHGTMQGYLRVLRELEAEHGEQDSGPTLAEVLSAAMGNAAN